jgi:hypothetical protein
MLGGHYGPLAILWVTLSCAGALLLINAVIDLSWDRVSDWFRGSHE